MRYESVMFKRVSALVLLTILALGSACTSGAKKGAAIGGVVGGATGAVIGNQSDHRTGTGAVVGATVGAAAGAIIGDYMSRQKKELEEIPGTVVVQDGDQLRVQMASNILFDIDSSYLKDSSRGNLEQMSDVLKKYEDTNLMIVGHTDNTGSAQYNQSLSERRAWSVLSYLNEHGVNANRLRSHGEGEARPIATNSSIEGRTLNRRVEVQIVPNEELKQKAMEQASKQG